MKFLKELHSLIYKDIVYSVSRNAWFYQKSGNGEWVDWILLRGEELWI